MSKNTTSLATLFLLALFIFQVNVHAQDAKFQQLEENGLVCMEAENYSGMRESAVETSWEPVTTPVDYSGTGAMQAMPEDYIEHKDLTHGQNNAPVLEYTVDFISPDMVYVWARTSHIDGYDDSVWFGLEEGIAGGIPLTYTTDEQVYSDEWYWINHLMNDNADRAVMDIGETGVLLFELYMREPAFKVDKIVLTTNPDYIPDSDEAVGPAETLAGTNAVSSEMVPHDYRLDQNYPNPFNPITNITFSLNESGHTLVQIYNEVGQLVETLVNEELRAGLHQTSFNADQFNSGIYFYKIQSGSFSEMKKMILLK
ncbi:T9SS type A sorting domain-containing protein [bacterium]